VVVDPVADNEMLQAWADSIIEDLKISVDTYEDTKRIKLPLVLT
jgi:hypothetical protein